VIPSIDHEVSAHINGVHRTGKSSDKAKVSCNWIDASGQPCNAIIASNGLFRHVASMHTHLMMEKCPICPRQFRRDSVGRHVQKKHADS